MLLLGIDIGTSSIKVSVVDSATQKAIASVQYPETEVAIISLQTGWAEQSPQQWWKHVQLAILKAHQTKLYNPKDIQAIGIAYQMHGLVCLDKEGNVLRDSIIWCDSRSVKIGNDAFESIGSEYCLSALLNSPGNFTASKLAWVKENEPALYNRIDTIMLPGDYIAYQLTNEKTTTITALSEGIFWDFKQHNLSKPLFEYFGFDQKVIPSIHDVFSNHGFVTNEVAASLSLTPGIPVTYKAGDQPNNALSLNVLQPGEFAATAGTSGVTYGVSDQLTFDPLSRVNTFAHVNHTQIQNRLGVLLCINGTGILNKWVKNITGNNSTYEQMNIAASTVSIGSESLYMLPFGNGAERMLQNKIVNSHLHNINLNMHSSAHIYRAAQEGIAFAFKYGFDILKLNKMNASVIKAGKANMFLSPVFVQSFVNAIGVPLELYDNDGSVGAAVGAGIGARVYQNEKEAFANTKPIEILEPTDIHLYNQLYEQWKQYLDKALY
ncbi:MAG: xylulokinase [Chitinophagaceae bacterium]